jgi:hypothetical protein
MRTRVVPIRSIFRSSDPDAVTVLRLLAAANDLRTMFRLMLDYTSREGSSSYSRSLSASVRNFVCRMGTIHLPDVWALVNSPDFHRVEERLARRVPETRQLADAFRKSINRNPLRALIAGVRNSHAGHPDRAAFERGLSLVEPEAFMDVPLQTDGLGEHFNVTDQLFLALLIDDSHQRYKASDAEESVRLLLDEMIAAQMALCNLAGALFVGMYLDAGK